MKDAEFRELEKQYYEEKYKRDLEEKAKAELERVKHDLEDAIEMNGWIDINKITLMVDRGVAQGQDGNQGYLTEQVKLEIKDHKLFRKCMQMYINELECKAGLKQEKEITLKDINNGLQVFKILTRYKIETNWEGVNNRYSVIFGLYDKKELNEVREVLRSIVGAEEEK